MTSANFGAVLFLSFCILRISLMMATNSSRNMQLTVVKLCSDRKNTAFLVCCKNNGEEALYEGQHTY